MKTFLVQLEYDCIPTPVQHSNPRAALGTFLALRKLNPIEWGSSADDYVEVGPDDEWDLAVCEPRAATSAGHVFFALS